MLTVLFRKLFHQCCLQFVEHRLGLLTAHHTATELILQIGVTLLHAIKCSLGRLDFFVKPEARITLDIDMILSIQVQPERYLEYTFVQVLAHVVHQHHIMEFYHSLIGILLDVESLTDVVVYHLILLWCGLQVLVIYPAFEHKLLPWFGNSASEEV